MGLCCLDIRSLFAFRASNYFKRNLLTFFQSFEAFHINRREVCEQIFATFVRCDKTKTFSVIKPFNNTSCHNYVTFIQKNLKNSEKLAVQIATKHIRQRNFRWFDVLQILEKIVKVCFAKCKFFIKIVKNTT